MPDEQLQCAVAGVEVRGEPGVDELCATVEVVLPQRGVELDVGLSSDVVDQDVEPALLAIDAGDEGADGADIQVVDDDGVSCSAGVRDQLRCSLDGLAAEIGSASCRGRMWAWC